MKDGIKNNLNHQFVETEKMKELPLVGGSVLTSLAALGSCGLPGWRNEKGKTYQCVY